MMLFITFPVPNASYETIELENVPRMYPDVGLLKALASTTAVEARGPSCTEFVPAILPSGERSVSVPVVVEEFGLNRYNTVPSVTTRTNALGRACEMNSAASAVPGPVTVAAAMTAEFVL